MNKSTTRNILKCAFLLVMVGGLLFLVWRFAYLPSPRYRTTSAFDKMNLARIRIVNDEGKTLEFEVKVADEDDEWQAGFQHVGEGIIEESLILFVFPHEMTAEFHMQNVAAPLDIAFMAADGAVLEVLRMEPSPTGLYGSKSTYRYVLETRAGFFGGYRISPKGSRLIVESISVP